MFLKQVFISLTLLISNIIFGQYFFYYDSITNDLSCEPGTLHLHPNDFDSGINSYNGGFLIVSDIDTSGNSVTDEIINSISDGMGILITNQDQTKILEFISNGAFPFGSDRIRITFETGSLVYNGPEGEGFSDQEIVSIEFEIIISEPHTIYPTILDTFSTHIDSDTLITFLWNPLIHSHDSSEYFLNIELERFGVVYSDQFYTGDTILNISSNSLDELMIVGSSQENEIKWYIDSHAGHYHIISDTNSFVLKRDYLRTVKPENILIRYELYNNYPNPFNPSTTLEFSIPVSDNVNIRVLDILGKEVDIIMNQYLTKGNHRIEWNGQGHPSGIYFISFESGDFIETQKVILMK